MAEPKRLGDYDWDICVLNTSSIVGEAFFSLEADRCRSIAKQNILSTKGKRLARWRNFGVLKTITAIDFVVSCRNAE
jgi:hypothetical protein